MVENSNVAGFRAKRPRDIVPSENSSPDQLALPVAPVDPMDQTLQKLAITSYLATKQKADLKRDIATRLLPSEGPFQPSDRFYYWTRPISNKGPPQVAGTKPESCHMKEPCVL